MKKRSKILASLVLAGTMVLGLAGCGDSGSANGGTQSGKNSDAKYQVGICQLVQHEALDAATKGFEDAGLDMEKEDSFRVGVIVGSGIGSLPQVENNY